MKVPKAGRPLAKCPHPKGSCSCQKLYAFMVRIPKGRWFCLQTSILHPMRINTALGSTCLCRPLYKVPADSKDTPQPTPAPSAAPMSSPAPGKVQKNGRRQSHLQAAPENLAKALESIPDLESHQKQDDASNHLFSYPPHNPAPSYSHTPLPSAVSTPNPFMPHNPVSSNGNSTPQSSGCCSGKAQPSMQTQDQGSCCGKPNPPAGNVPQRESRQGRCRPPQMNGTSYSQLSPAPQFSPWQDVNATEQDHYTQPFPVHQPQTQTSAYFPEYGPNVSSTASMGIQHQDPLHDIGLTQSSIHPLLSTSSNFTYTPPQAFGDSSNNCNCGDDCQCLGCATHPFNNTTRQHVREMGALVSLDGEDPNLEVLNGYQPSVLPSQSGTSLADYSFAGIGNPIDTGVQQNAMQRYSEQAANPDLSNGYSSPAGYASGRQLMAPSEYYTLEYSVGLPNSCTDMTGSCQCGSDCSCVGCLTHSGHNGISLEPGAMEDPAPEPVSSALEQSDVSLSRIPVLDDLSVPASSPHVIDP